MVENILFENINFKHIELDKEYYNCRFKSCDFSNIEINNTDFDNCTFEFCNFTMSKFSQLLTEVNFKECKMTGTDFTGLNRCSGNLSFINSLMNYSIFTSKKLRKMNFISCKMNEAYFDEADIAGSIFDNCDLYNTHFIGSNLEKVDFSTSYNISLIPNQCKLKKTKFPEQELRGLVSHLDIIIV